MNFKIQKQIFESVLTNIQPFLEKKDQTQITSHIKITSKNNHLFLEATDNEIGLSIQNVGLEVGDDFTFTVNGKKILDIVRILKEGFVDVDFENDQVIISQESSRFKLPTFEADSFPPFPQIEDKASISLDSSKLIEGFKKITPAIDTNNPKFELNGALVDIKADKTSIVGTDTRRLAIKTIEGANDQELSIIVLKKAIMEIQKLFLDEIEMFYDENNLIIKSNNYYFFTRLVNGKYPDYERIIPKSAKHELTLDKKEMVDAIKMITTISQEIKLTIASGTILFESLAEDNIEAKTSINIDGGLDQEFTMAVNSRYILDFLNQSGSETFTLQLNEPSLPFVLKNEDFITVVMPIVL